MTMPGSRSRGSSWIALAALAGCFGAGEDPPRCEPGDPAHERHGTDCLCCHEEFGVAGSVDLTGAPVALVRVTDARGRTATMAPNPYGNFFRHLQLEPPLAVVVEGPAGDSVKMAALAPHGACNRCHAPSGAAPPIVGPLR